MKTQQLRLFMCTVVIGLILLLLAAPQSGDALSQSQAGLANADDPQQKDTCQAILAHALDTLNNTCDKLDRNNACYGNDAVQAELNSTTVKFNTLGDRAPIRMIKRLVTSPLDMQKGTWGLSLLKLQANLPDTMPGQNVLFLVYGNTTVDNASGNMQAFYFTSGLGSPACKEAPRDGILVRSPDHTEVTFTANGVQITIASTVILRAEQNKTLDVLLVEGHARVTSPQGSQTLQPGQTVSVPLGGSTGLEPVSQPSAPVTVAPDSTLPIILVSTEKFSPAHAPINVSVEGCITKVQGNTVTIQGQDIQFQPNDSVLSGAKVGDCVRVNGNLQSDQGKSVILAIPNLSSPPTVKPNAIQPNSGNNADNADDPGKSSPVNNAGGSGGGSNGGGNSGGGGSNSGGNTGGNGNSSPTNSGSIVPTSIPTSVVINNPPGTAAPTTATDSANPGNNGDPKTPTAVQDNGSGGNNSTPAPGKDGTPPTPDKGKDGKGDHKGEHHDSKDKGDKGNKGNGDNNNGNPQNNGANPAEPGNNNGNNNGNPQNNPAGSSNSEPANNPAPINNPVNAVSTP